MFRLAAILGIPLAILVAVLLRRRAKAGATCCAPGRLAALAYVLTIVGAAILTATGLWAAAIRGGSMHGLLLLAHFIGAPLFVAGLPLMAVLGAEDCRFASDARRCWPAQKAMFWAMLLAGAGLLATALASMYPWFGTDGQVLLLAVHRWCGLAFVVSAILHAHGLGKAPAAQQPMAGVDGPVHSHSGL